MKSHEERASKTIYKKITVIKAQNWDRFTPEQQDALENAIEFYKKNDRFERLNIGDQVDQWLKDADKREAKQKRIEADKAKSQEPEVDPKLVARIVAETIKKLQKE